MNSLFQSCILIEEVFGIQGVGDGNQEEGLGIYVRDRLVIKPRHFKSQMSYSDDLIHTLVEE